MASLIVCVHCKILTVAGCFCLITQVTQFPEETIQDTSFKMRVLEKSMAMITSHRLSK